MTPEEIKKATLRSLQEAVTKMMSPEWDLYLDGKPRDVVEKAGMTLLATQRARLRLENAELAEIAAKLSQNEKDLTDGKTNLDKALSDLKNVQMVLDTASALLKVVGRVVAIAAGGTLGG
jgi:Zn-dependent oligopeptidase